MTTTTEELRKMIRLLSPEPGLDYDTWAMYRVIDHLNNHIEALESEVKKLKASSKRTADTASCLANGIQPD